MKKSYRNNQSFVLKPYQIILINFQTQNNALLYRVYHADYIFSKRIYELSTKQNRKLDVNHLELLYV